LSLPLEGIKVIDFSWWLFGPLAAALLGDAGADVIKVEDTRAGDPMRGVLATGALGSTDTNYVMELANHNKRSIAVNVKSPGGREILYTLVQEADVFITSMRLSVLERLGVDYPSLRRLNPQLIYARGSGYGPSGPERERAGFDELAYWSRGGFASVLGEPGSPPVPLHGAMGDIPTATFLMAGVLLALYHREQSGLGQEVHTSLYGSGIWTNGQLITFALVTGQDAARVSRKSQPNPLYNTYQTGDKRWLQLAMLNTDRHWPSICRALGYEDLIADPRFDTHEKRLRHSREIIALLDEIFLRRTLQEWAAVLDGYDDIFWAPVQSVKEITVDPQAVANSFFRVIATADGQEMKLPCPPFQLSHLVFSGSGAPEWGQHTDEVLLELGYRTEKIEELRRDHVIL
jgi:crotonobetainyl-CoA:carnitine CoA-transferase CaiB-like acyl-CoA transferase